MPVRDLKRDLRRDQHFAPGTILRIQVDTTHPVGYGMAADTYGFYNNSPFFALSKGFTSPKTTVVARYPTRDVVASGWLQGRRADGGRAAVVSVDMNPGRVVLFGLRPQHRAQTHATFPMLFNALYLSTARDRSVQHHPTAAVIRIFVTGGTFDKEYNELNGTLSFKDTHIPEMLRLGRCRVEVAVRTLMMIDSLRDDRRRPLADRRAVPLRRRNRASSSRTAPTRWSTPRGRWRRRSRLTGRRRSC